MSFSDVLPRVEIPLTQGDEVAQDLDALFVAHYAVLTRIVYRIIGDTGWAEEVAAEAFWRLHSKPPAECQNIPGWLYRTAMRLALDNLKKRKRRAHYEALAPPPNTVNTPEQSFEQLERRQRVRQILAAVKPDHAALLVLRSEGYSLAEIAKLLGLNPNSVGTCLARADQAFRKEYVKRYGEQ